tara:strand:- start:1087 stop:1305 length:219 start_codon:yes stop_codon:yes gene_type:complete
MKLTYWMCECLNDSSAYDIRAKTKKGALQERADRSEACSYGEAQKVTLEYADSFDLLDACLGEAGFNLLQIK